MNIGDRQYSEDRQSDMKYEHMSGLFSTSLLYIYTYT